MTFYKRSLGAAHKHSPCGYEPLHVQKLRSGRCTLSRYIRILRLGLSILTSTTTAHVCRGHGAPGGTFDIPDGMRTDPGNNRPHFYTLVRIDEAGDRISVS